MTSDPDHGGEPEEDADPDAANPEIERSARDAERLRRHGRSFDDAAGTNPDRSQQTRRPGGA